MQSCLRDSDISGHSIASDHAPVDNNAKLASEAIRESLALDPNLSEGYTALAELALNTQPRDADESIKLALLATRVNPNNFGARRILGRLYAYQSKFVTGPFDATAGEKAIAEWKQVARLDPRNAEAWAFLSDLYDRTGKTDDSIDALKRWLSAAAPVDSQFYQMLTGGRQLGPENAALKLGEALLKAGKTREAIQTIANLVVDEPGNLAAVELLREAVDNAEAADAAIAVEALRQAVYANPSNASLVTLLAQIQARSGQVEEAATLLRETSSRLQPTDRPASAGFLVTLGDLYGQVDRPTDAVAAYESAFTTYGLMPTDTPEGDEQEFATGVFEKMIQTLKSAGRFQEAKAVIDRSRNMLGKNDMFADRQAISFFRETGNRAEALAAVQNVRRRDPSDEGFIRLEATLLTETGRVDEAVALIKKLIDTPPSPPVVTNPSTSRESIAIAVPHQIGLEVTER
jgi:tetratricopeptide (TPR) repeat protein